MTSFLTHLRSGDWVSAERMRGYSLILIAIATLAIAIWIARSDGLIDPNGKPIGTDFSNTYAAGKLLHAGRAPDAYDPELQHAAEKAVFGRDVPFYGWHYPPFFFAVAAIVALLPYGWGLALWLIASLSAYLVTMRAIVPRPETLLLALAFPASFVNIGHGQNGFLTATLLGGALYFLPRKPWIAGILIGCLAYKPQFGILIPLCLLVDRRWSTIAAATCTVIMLAGLSSAVLGIDIWKAFAASTAFTQTVILEAGSTGWEKMQSAFAATRLWGAPLQLAYAVQGMVFVTLAAALAWLWRSDAAFELKASALATASVMSTPYSLDYDMVALAVSIAFMVRHGLAKGFRDYEISILAIVWAAPLFARPVATLTEIPLGLIAMLLLFAATIHRATSDLGIGVISQRKVAQV